MFSSHHLKLKKPSFISFLTALQVLIKMLNECSFCGVSGEEERLFNAVGNKAVVLVCENCSIKENVPIIQRPTTFQLKEAERSRGVYERLSKTAGIDKQNQYAVGQEKRKWEEEVRRRDLRLKDIVNASYKLKQQKVKSPRLELVDNFHWIIMRGRRDRHLTQKELAESIGESEASIKMAEQGILPEDEQKLVNKIESFLGIRIKKSAVQESVDREMSKTTQTNITSSQISQTSESKPIPTKLDFKNITTLKNLTIHDLKRMKEEKNKSRENHEEQKSQEDNSIDEEDIYSEDELLDEDFEEELGEK